MVLSAEHYTNSNFFLLTTIDVVVSNVWYIYLYPNVSYISVLMVCDSRRLRLRKGGVTISLEHLLR